MELLVLNTAFESVAVIDAFESCIWTDRLYECGDFEIYMSMNDELLTYIVQDYYLWNAESQHLMIIEQLSIETDTEDGAHLTVTGRSLESILDRRIIWGQKTYSGNLQNVIKTMLNETIIAPSISDRKIDNFKFQESSDEGITSLTIEEAQYTGDNLYDIIQVLCEQNKIGFQIILNDDNQFVFSIYRGVDRSYEQEINPYVIFSPGFENIINSSYLESNKSLKNITLVAGEGEGSARKTVTVGSGAGLSRRELFTDARDLSTTVDGGTISDATYNAQLQQRGKEKLAENISTIAFEGKAETTRMFKYGEDFFIGDIVQIENEYGHEGRAYISEFIISQDRDGTSMYPTFSTIQKEEVEE